MTTAFQAQGAQGKPSKYAPLFTRKFWTGLYTNGSALGDPATPYLYEKFYSGTRYDHLVDGFNCELTPQYSLARAAGHSVYNSQTFPAIDAFYEFRTFTTNTERIYVMADTAATVYDATGPNTKTTIFTKSGGAGQTFFEDAGNNVLYFGNGTDQKKWLPLLSSFNAVGAFLAGNGSLVNPVTWSAGGTRLFGDMIIDPNGNIQMVITGGTSAGSQPSWNATPFGTTVDNTATWRNHGPLVQGWGVAAPAAAPTVTAPTSPNIYAVRFWMPGHTYGAGASGNYVVFDGAQKRMKLLVDGTKTTGTTYPAWNVNAGGATVSGVQGITNDGTATWLDLGNMFSLSQYVALGNGAAGQLLATTVTVIDDNNNIQTVSVAGNTGAQIQTVAFNSTAGGTTVDGTVTWTCCGNANVCVQQGYTYYSANFAAGGQFSNLSKAAQPTGAVMGNAYSATIAGAGSSDSQVTDSIVFRTVDGGVTPFGKITDGSAQENSNTTWSLTDTTSDRLLDNTQIGETTLQNSPPPAGLINLCFHLGRIFGSVGNDLFYSLPANQTIGIGYESWAPLNFRGDKSFIVRLEPTAIGLLVHTVSGTDILPTKTDGTPGIQVQPYLPGNGSGLRSWNAYARNGSTIYMFSASGNLLSLDASTGVTYAGHPIANILQNLNGSAVYLAFHEQGEDIGLYVSDGATGFVRMANTVAPETGTAWSPQRNIAHKCIQSVEVSPGVQRLLLGPAVSGPILYRDPTVNKDNGVAFAWSGTIGTLALAQPGQMAEVEFLTTICKNVGSHPAVSILIDELSGPFEGLNRNTQDPPRKFASKTLMMDRFCTVVSNQPAKFMYAQIKISFPAEDARNEVLAYSMWGCHWQEK